jgi:hypothetical protein
MRLKNRSSLSILILLSACSEKAFNSAVYTDPARAKNYSSDEPKKDEESSADKNRERMKHRLDGKRKGKDGDKAVVSKDPKSDKSDTGEAPATTVASDDSIETRRSKARADRLARRSARIKDGKGGEVVAPGKEPAKDAVASSTEVRKFRFNTQSVEGINSRELLSLLVGVPNLTQDEVLNLETLNQGALSLKLTQKDKGSEFYTADGSLDFIIQKEVEGATGLELVEETRTLVLQDIAYLRKTGPGQYEGKLKSGSSYYRIRIRTFSDTKEQSGEILRINAGREDKVLELVGEKDA